MARTIISITGIIVAGLVFFYYTRPAYDNVHVLQAQIGQYDQALDKSAELQKLKDTLLSRYNAFDPNAKIRLQKMVPDHVDNIRLILDIDSLAGRFGMALQNVIISAPGDGADQTVIGAISSGKQKYDSLTLKFSVRSTYANFVKFMEQLESSLRMVEVVSLTITPESAAGALAQGGGLSGGNNYKYDITIRTFWLR